MLPGIMEDDAYRMPPPVSDATDAVSQVHTVGSLRPLDRAMMDGEDDRVTLPKRHHLHPRLHARPLLCQHELAAGEILTGGR